RGRRALEEFKVRGVASTIPAHLAVLAHPDFNNATHHTRWMEDTVVVNNADPAPSPFPQADEDVERRDITVEIGGRRFSVTYWAPEVGTGAAVRRRPPKLSNAGSAPASDGMVIAPMQGTIVKVHVTAGASVKEGDPICVLEAMKMENEVKAPNSGEVVDLRVQPGDTVTPGQVIAIVK
ncbi:MAG TPA: biotin/lipoyl-containing protein, partial [Acidimicrobiia bacterium]|nr:biotin/lipoyl-containing protein [Acidimicrobiia bacterium]